VQCVWILCLLRDVNLFIWEGKGRKTLPCIYFRFLMILYNRWLSFLGENSRIEKGHIMLNRDTPEF